MEATESNSVTQLLYYRMLNNLYLYNCTDLNTTINQITVIIRTN